MHVMSETMKNNNCLTQTLTNVLKELPKNMSKLDKGDCYLPRSQSVRINDEFSSDEDTLHRNHRPRESVEEYAAELKRLYDQAYPATDRQTRREDLLRKLLDGLRDDTARFQVEYNKEPHDIDEAVAHVVNFVETKARLSKSDPYYERKPRRQTRKVENLNSQKEDKETFDKEYKQLGYYDKGSNSDIITCFCCGKEGHIARNCWKRGNTQNQENRNDRQSFNSKFRNNKNLN
ncbi:unnamed protein product [Mytilus coruscus]|uniref:CCHC-type domain-containing protein n=1 Tax=Mytilus coruscus TaxID=42192 RepID=A0A6J8DXI4_MYTCO|nr:unnamed protein product [Mytilus coruscus]